MDNTFELLIKDHEKVKQIIETLLSTTANAKKKRQELLLNLKEELQLHEEIEESAVYPVFKEKKDIKNLTLEAYEEHHVVDILLAELENLDFQDEAWKAKLTVLQENLFHHISEEEKEVFPLASQVLKQDELEKMESDIIRMKNENS
ncbi:MAG: hemerythrin domain-containing protein [Burkholderiales bacterium]|nr:hemerythrin domain-containing protein [Burkholderiales bacterium]